MAPSPLHGYPALKVSITLLLGILTGAGLELPLLLPLIAFLFVLLLLFHVATSPRYGGSGSMTVALSLHAAVFLLGVAKITADQNLQPPVPERLLSSQILLRGRIIDTQTRMQQRTRFVVQSEVALDSGRWRPLVRKMLVTVRRRQRDSTTLTLKYGRNVLICGQLSRPPEARNPGEFNARAYYEANGIALFMDVRGHDAVSVDSLASGLSPFDRVIVACVEPTRLYIHDLIDRTVGGEEGEFLKGIIIGEHSGLSPELRQTFVNAGVAHILAVSGSNTAVIALVLLSACSFLRLPRWASAAITSAGLLFYMLLAGNQPPVVRATIMALVILGATWLQRKVNALNSLGVAALCILLYDARQVFDVGFQLSFVAVLSLVYLYPKLDATILRINRDTRFRRGCVWALRLCGVSAVASLGTLPFTAASFGRVSIVGLLANMIVIPAAGWSIALGLVSVVSGVFSSFLADAFGATNKIILWSSLSVARVAGNSPIAYVDTMRYTWVDALPYYALLVVVFHWTDKKVVRAFSLVLLATLNIAVFLPAPAAFTVNSSNLRLSFIDVGQGDAALIELPGGETVLVDAGPRSGEYDVGERVVAPFLMRRNISTIDLLIITHPHGDHTGGVPSLLKSVPIRRILLSGQGDTAASYNEALGLFARRNIPVDTARAGVLCNTRRGARLYVLSPLSTHVSTDTAQIHPNLNMTSVVVKLLYGKVSVILCGDTDREAEAEMVQTYGDFLSSTLLKVGHHGSASSSSAEFLEAVKPTVAVISVGRNNRFHHPSPTVVQRLAELNVETLRTDEEGAVVFESDGRSLWRVDWR